MAEQYTPLASAEDVVEALGRDLTPSEENQVRAKIAKASELFRKEARRTFTRERSAHRLKVNGGEVRIPDGPIVEIHAVTDDDGHHIDWKHRFGMTIEVCRRSHEFVIVDYTHGAEEIPVLVRETVAEVVARVFGVDKRAKSGLSQFQKTTGPFSDGGTFAAWAVGGQVTLSPSDIECARSFRPVRTANTIVQRS